MERPALMIKIAIALLAVPIIIGAALFGPAGTLDYYEAWAYMGVLLVPIFFVVMYFLKKDPGFLERRMRMKEKEAKQGLIVGAASVVFLVGFLIPGFDKRFGWSDVPSELVVAADVLVFLGYAIVFLVFRENSYAGRTVQVDKGQKVISSGPYSIIRHPMYFGTLLMYLATPIALGSYIAAPVFFLLVPIIMLRILNEEEVLRRDLPGYREYCEKTRHRLIPHVW